jgi:thioredoxin reductase
MKKIELAIIGAGPAGIAAATTAAKFGVQTTLIDEYVRPGGQLIKQTHKFFGSEAHKAGIRGIDIARQFCSELEASNVELMMGTTVWSIFDSKILSVCHGGITEQIRAEKTIIATGASENAISFPGWTLPGVMTAGAAQTSMNVNRILPGKRVLMVGAGNVGCIIAYQLLQAGAEEVTIIEAKPEIGAYAVHSAKVARLGMRILTSHTVKEVLGDGYVEKAVIVGLDKDFVPILGTEESLDLDMVCIACGLSPMTELAYVAKCEFVWSPILGGFIPKVDAHLESSVEGIYIAGDCGGVEEASTAIEEGTIAAISVAETLGYLFPATAAALRNNAYQRLNELRSGPFGQTRADAKNSLHVKANTNE